MKNNSYIQERENMVRIQLEKRGIHDERILDAFRKVPRHEFVPKKYRNAAYTDNPIPIGYEQTVSQPYVVAHMIQEVNVQVDDITLDIGSGSGYSVAIMSLLCKWVYGIERIKPLADRSARTLESLGYENIEIKCADGFEGWPEKAPFDVITLGAAPTEIPAALKSQMNDGGRLIAPVGEFEQQLIVLEKQGENLNERTGTLVRFVPMKHGKFIPQENNS